MKNATLQIYGSFCLRDRDGTDLTPRSNRAKALLAILILSPEARRSRTYLQGMLWKTEQASARMSLRTCLSDIRRNLRKSVSGTQFALQSNHKFVWLDPNLIELIEPRTDSEREALLKGVNVHNSAFHQWINDQKIRHASENHNTGLETSTGAHDDRRKIWLHTDEDIPFSLTVDQLQSQLLLNLSEQSPIKCVDHADGRVAEKNAGDAIIQILPYMAGDTRYLSLSLKSLGSRAILWRETVRPYQSENKPHDSTIHLRSIAHDATENILKALREGENSHNHHELADQLVGKALRRAFTFVPQNILEGKALLQHAQQYRPHAHQLAWLSTVIMFECIELPQTDLTPNLEEYRACSDEALTAAPRNAFVLSTLCKPKLLLEGDIDAARAMADEALRINPGLAQAHISSSICACHAGKLKEAINHALTGLRLGKQSPYRHWWYMFLSLAQIRSGLFEDAIVSAQKALLGAPTFKVPMRHLYALYLSTGQHQQAINVLTKLRKLEPDFSLDFVRNNPSFPASTLRTTPLIEQQDIALNLPAP